MEAVQRQAHVLGVPVQVDTLAISVNRTLMSAQLVFLVQVAVNVLIQLVGTRVAAMLD